MYNQSKLPIGHPYKFFAPAQISPVVIITPSTIATVTLSSLSGSSGTITWTSSTDAVGYYWYVGTGAGSGSVVSGTVTSGSTLTATASYSFTSGTTYYAWVIPYSSTGTSGATTISDGASYTAGGTYSYSATLLPWPATTGYTQYTGSYTSIDDGSSTRSATLPVAFSMNATSSTAVFMSTNGFFTLASGNGGIYSSPQQLSGMLAGNPGDNWLQNGLTMTDGDQQYWWYKVSSDGSGKYNIKNICFNGVYGNSTFPRSWLGNLYRDSTYQWYETRVKLNTAGTVGPYNGSSVEQSASTTSRVWRGDLNGQNWTYMGTGSVV